MLDSLAGILAPFSAEAYYVGGCVRDLLLGRPIKDVDIAVAADPRAVGEAVRRAVGGHFFWLRERDGTARVMSREPGSLQLDIVPLVLPIEEDLRRRDYTVNAMAIPVAAGLASGAPILDPTGGQADLKARRLRLASEDALNADPLRTLRGVRLAVQLGFALEAETTARIRSAGPWLERVSRERIRDELFLCLAAPDSAAAARWMAELDLLAHALPEMVPVLEGGEWKATLAHLAAVERLPAALPVSTAVAEALLRHLDRPLKPPRDRPSLLKFGALLWRLSREGERAEAGERPGRGTPLRKIPGVAAQIGKQLALSGAEAAWVARLLAHRETASAWVQEPPPIGRALYRFWKETGDTGVDALLIAVAEPGAAGPTPGLEAVLARLLEYERGEHPALLSGQEVMALTGLEPGPALGRRLDALAEAEADGLVRTPEEAREWIARQSKQP